MHRGGSNLAFDRNDTAGICNFCAGVRDDRRAVFGRPVLYALRLDFHGSYTEGLGVALHQTAGNLVLAVFATVRRRLAGVSIVHYVQLAAGRGLDAQRVGLRVIRPIARAVDFIDRTINGAQQGRIVGALGFRRFDRRVEDFGVEIIAVCLLVSPYYATNFNTKQTYSQYKSVVRYELSLAIRLGLAIKSVPRYKLLHEEKGNTARNHDASRICRRKRRGLHHCYDLAWQGVSAGCGKG